MLVAYIPSPKFGDAADDIAENKTQEDGLPGVFRKRLYHRCLTILTWPLRNKIPRRVLDADGYWRDVLYILMLYIADMEEQWLIACLANFNCVHCLARSGDLGKEEPCEHRTGQWILDQIEAVRASRGEDASIWSFVLGCRQRGLNGVMHPFWKYLPWVDICQLLSQEVLHSYHKFFFDHPLKWNTCLMGEKEMDRRLQSQPQQVGVRSFPKGISHISQMSGKEHRALERTHLAVVSGAPGASTEVVTATRAMLDYIYLAQYPSHNERTLEQLKNTVNLFHTSKGVWLKKGARRSKEGNIIDHMDIPKAHTPLHAQECIELKGSCDNYNAETPEHLHIEDLKNAYPYTNHRGYQTQMIRYLVRRDSVNNFNAFQAYFERTWPADAVDPLEVEHAATGDEMAVRRKKRTRTPRMENSQIMLNKRPDRVAMSVGAIEKLFGLPFFQRDLLRYINALRDSTSPSSSAPLDVLPAEYQRLNVWFSVRIQAPRPNVYYKEEWWRIRAQPSLNDNPARFDPVLLTDKEGATASGLKGEKSNIRSRPTADIDHRSPRGAAVPRLSTVADSRSPIPNSQSPAHSPLTGACIRQAVPCDTESA